MASILVSHCCTLRLASFTLSSPSLLLVSLAAILALRTLTWGRQRESREEREEEEEGEANRVLGC